MRIQFDPNQAYQLDAVSAVADLFEGQPLAQGETEISLVDQGGLELSELGLANQLILQEEAILANLREIQTRNSIDGFASRDSSTFTIEMETGTGKTYVYLRTIFELNRRYGWKKFIIVVPSVAIREGVKTAIDLTRSHFADIFDNVPIDTWIYDSSQASRLRSFATGNTLQILILNIQAFISEKSNVIYQDRDNMSGYRPLEFIQNARPIVILDEPQNLEGDKQKEAIPKLNALFQLRYSATHKELINPVYRLDPVQAYDMGLVKKIEVSSVLDEPDFNRPYIFLKEVNDKGAKLEIDIEGTKGPERKLLTIRNADEDLFDLSRGREQYRGYIVEEIDTGAGYVRFGNGLTLRAGESCGSNRDDVMRAQVKETLKQHFEKERKLLQLPESERMKVLSLFFIDRVANYASEDGKIRTWFEEEYTKLAGVYPELTTLPAREVHAGYFAQDKAGAKDTNGKTKADDGAYELIMQDKERLLSADEPVRFIFSHSALREGWDNPNVFQICTLNETRSEMRKRQEIGRGLRLPVRANGTRCFEDDYNRLTVIANERYEQFAKSLQNELKEECGVDFAGRIKNSRDRRPLELRKGWALDENFKGIWDKISAKTRYNVHFETSHLIDKAARDLKLSPAIHKPRISVKRGAIDIKYAGVTVREGTTANASVSPEEKPAVPDMLTYLQRETDLTRSTLAEILIQSGRLADALINPQQFMSQALTVIRSVLKEFLAEGIEYEKISGLVFEQRIFEESGSDPFIDRLVKVDHSIYKEIEVDSQIERRFAEDLDRSEEVLMFFKLPRRFTVDTPLGTYNPDWAIVKQADRKLYLIRETKGSLDPSNLRVSENAKLYCGKKHFEKLGVGYETVTTADQV